ncbi:MAG: glycosyltransferase family 2 protein [Candidatus Krumholzibacteriota bacterium]|nr:glycosyltransferase family 2 protein [Candidatus Krumholzibacteriota bacterium]
MKNLSILVPVYYNEATLEALYARFLGVEQKLAAKAKLEFVFVDDGSKDGSRKVLRGLHAKDPEKVRLIFLSRNFGSFNAILAGLNHVEGDCTAIISADLQDPPEILVDMYQRWEEGEQTVMAVREDRKDPLFSRIFSAVSYTLLRRLALPEFPRGGFDFVLIDRKVREVLVDINERNTSLMGLIVWVGFRQSEISYTRGERGGGKSMWTFWKKVKYFIDSILAFSFAPIRTMSAIGSVLGILGIAYAIFLIISKFTFGIAVPGWTALMVAVLVLFGIQFISLGVIGEYIWRTLDGVRDRPAFIVDEIIEKETEDSREEDR